MYFNAVIKDFSQCFEAVNRLRTEMFLLNQRVNEGDPIAVLMEYNKSKETFKVLRMLMTDLERSMNEIKNQVPDLPPSYETDQTS